MNSEVSVVILTYNESKHIKRCLERAFTVASSVYVVDSFSTDDTVEIARAMGGEVYQHRWPGNQAAQFNWALEHLPITTEWILRLDADEYLTDELQDEINAKLPLQPDEITGVSFKRRHIFMDKWVKRGTYPVTLLRLFRRGKAVCEQRWMDEHIHLLEGKSVTFEHDFVDHNLHNLAWWTTKHNGYATREAIELLDLEYQLIGRERDNGGLNEQASIKRSRKKQYSKQPLFWRSFAYFLYRYILKGGFLEGKEGFMWHFFQGWWYRTLVDSRVYEVKKACGNDPALIRDYIQRNYQIELSPKKSLVEV
ncbi:glycosyltransferase family 2 protein [Echinicola strongylocentroti]|uniref:Glycosyltransferase family 2 protein n=1 Tax=Echinicola strongylocentroti TaxID=1795355 RepID=A0A2Z4IPF6_9BACT|nr:glycosyltransferase family 2 protein [Echinicola strongylocentroti]AWW32589.1 glycosyltransferase family 2 protein [Echinicola strongylocentroti]